MMGNAIGFSKAATTSSFYHYHVLIIFLLQMIDRWSGEICAPSSALSPSTYCSKPSWHGWCMLSLPCCYPAAHWIPSTTGCSGLYFSWCHTLCLVSVYLYTIRWTPGMTCVDAGVDWIVLVWYENHRMNELRSCGWISVHRVGNSASYKGKRTRSLRCLRRRWGCGVFWGMSFVLSISSGWLYMSTYICTYNRSLHYFPIVISPHSGIGDCRTTLLF